MEVDVLFDNHSLAGIAFAFCKLLAKHIAQTLQYTEERLKGWLTGRAEQGQQASPARRTALFWTVHALCLIWTKASMKSRALGVAYTGRSRLSARTTKMWEIVGNYYIRNWTRQPN